MKADVIMQSAAVYSEPNIGSMQEDQRALQIALELSNLGLLGNCDDDASVASYEDAKNKKSQNMTECVPVPSSEHVAEIVGRQGCKIKALRAKTNTYIKTPVRGEEPVFVVTGRKEDVAMARREVQSAAEHFTQIRASRNRHAALMNGHLPSSEASAGTITLQVRVPYRVVGLVVGPKGATIKRIQQQTHTYIVTPSRDKEPVFEVTGLPENVEKAKEEIEAHIAARTGTQQVNIDDDFKNNGTEVDGPVSQNLKQPPVSGGLLNASGYSPSAFTPYSPVANSNLRSQAPSFIPTSVSATGARSEYRPVSQFNPATTTAEPFHPGVTGFPYSFDQADNLLYPALPNMGSVQSWSTGPSAQLDSPNSGVAPFGFTPLRSSSSTGNGGFSPTSSFGSTGIQRLSPTLSDPEFSSFTFLPNSTQASHNPLRRVGSDSVESTTSSVPSLDLLSNSCNLASVGNHSSLYSTTPINIESGYSSGGTTDSITSGSPTDSSGPLSNLLSPRPTEATIKPRLQPQQCIMCLDSTVSAALVPCGHNHFCFSCANKVVSRPGAVCPCCNRSATMALLIKK